MSTRSAGIDASTDSAILSCRLSTAALLRAHRAPAWWQLHDEHQRIRLIPPGTPQLACLSPQSSHALCWSRAPSCCLLHGPHHRDFRGPPGTPRVARLSPQSSHMSFRILCAPSCCRLHGLHQRTFLSPPGTPQLARFCSQSSHQICTTRAPGWR
eukprot:COSAG01_NODE_14369_length_1462_cov_46.157740_1_plen_155_part_00